MPKLGNLKLRTFVISQFLWVKNPDAAYLSVSGSKSLMNCQDVGWGYSLTWRLDWRWGMGVWGGGNGNICFQAHAHGCCPPTHTPDPLLKTASWHGNWLPPSVSQLRQSETGTQDGSQCLYNPVVTSGLLYFCLLELIQNVQPILKVRGLSKSMNIKRMGLVGGHLRGCLPQTYTEKYTNINLHESSLYGHNCVIVI